MYNLKHNYSNNSNRDMYNLKQNNKKTTTDTTIINSLNPKYMYNLKRSNN